MNWLLLFSVLAIAFANGANDNFKGVATLYGSRTTGFRRALAWATVTTAGGSLLALAFSGSLLARFSGQGLVPEAVTRDPTFLASVGGGAAVTVLLASLLGAPISTTHALLGALAGAAFLASGGSLRLPELSGTFLAPLLVSPLLATGFVGLAYPLSGGLRRRLTTDAGTCLCMAERQLAQVRARVEGMAATPVPLTVVASTQECVARGLSPAVSFPRTLNAAHFLSAGVVGFARGVNDTPKLVALLIPLQAFGIGWALPFVATGIAVGGVLGSRRVAHTLSHRITDMTPDQGLVANLVTASLVLVASRFGLPVSTTHVSAGSLFGLGAVTRTARRSVIGQVVFAWIATIPFAALCGALLWLALRRGHI